MNYLATFLVLATFLTLGFCQWPEELYVAQDGSGDYTTIQSAINATRDLSQVKVRIYIKAGLYKEKVVVPSWKTKICLIGESQWNTIISNDDYWGKPLQDGHLDPIGTNATITYTSYTLLAQGDDFEATELTIENTAGPVGQAVALHVEGDRAVVNSCRLLGHQDTLYCARAGTRQFYQDCFIEGTTDFIFGEAVALFQNCTIRSLRDSYITASASPPWQTFGFVFKNCELEASVNATRVYLGRPWRPYAKTVFLNTKMGEHILKEGWDNWDNPANELTAYYGEYMSSGVDVSERVNWSRQLTAEEASMYTTYNIFSIDSGWAPPTL